MNADRRTAIVRLLEESHAAFRSAVAAIPTEYLNVRPGPDQWSTLEIVEHVAIAENGMFRMLRSATPVAATLENPESEATLARNIVSRETKGHAPERAHPKGRYPDIHEALEKFTSAREQTIQFAKETETDLFFVSATHPLFGPVNGYELLIIMAGHVRRHADQITETKSSLG